MRLVDPLGVLLRKVFSQTYTIRRRAYSVRAPMALWHVDSNHKLISWRFIFHGGIDGYSRLPVYMEVASDNTAATALESFLSGVSQYGVPQRVITDKGLENIKFAEYMLEYRGLNRGSHITGRSVHNQRIERFWRELWQGCTCTYYELFQKMEHEGILNVDNEVHLLALHLVFENRIQCSLDRFLNAIARRPLRTEQNRTPLQLWIMGQFTDPDINFLPEELETFSIDYDDSPVACSDVNNGVVVPPLISLHEDEDVVIREIVNRETDNPFELQEYFDICSHLERNTM